jgi:hypothetical protein
MKKLLLLFLSIILYSCSGDDVITSANTTAQKTKSTSKISSLTVTNVRTPDLYVPELETGWQYRGPIGLRLPTYPADVNTYWKVFNGKLPMYLFIANKPGTTIDYTGQSDFVYDATYDYYSGGYNIVGLFRITSYVNGIPTEVNTSNYYSENTEPDIVNGGVNGSLQTYSLAYYLNSGTARELYNESQLRPGVVDGLNLVVVEINPDRLINESDYTNNVTTLPLMVTGDTAVLDLNAIAANQTIPVVLSNNLKNRSGKTITFSWTSVYDTTNVKVKYHFIVKKNGVVVADNLTKNSYSEVLRGKPTSKSNIYEIITSVNGLGESIPVKIIK